MADDAQILELRIHGVNNTAPHDLLDLPVTGVEQVAGDALGSFWRPTAAAVERLRPGERGFVPDGVVREAYSWGGLARTTPTMGVGVIGSAVRLVGRAGWALLIPFGLVNVAFWSRRLDVAGAAHGWQAGRQAAALRVFGFLLTLLVLGSVSVVALDLLATQCLATDQRCEVLPAAVGDLAGWTHGRRLALGSLVPLVVLGVLVLLATVSRSRYEQLAAVPTAQSATTPPKTVLQTPGFWSNARLTSTLGRAHVAGGLWFMVLATAWHQVFGTGPACATPPLALGSARAACWAQVWPLAATGWPFVGTLVSALVGLGVVLHLLSSGAWGRAADVGSAAEAALERRGTRLAVTAGVGLAVHLGLLTSLDHEVAVEVPLLGLVATPAVLTTALVAIAVAAGLWRGRPAHDDEAWGGRAPAVFLVLALGVALTLSSVLVVGAGDWLNGDRPARALLRAPGQRAADTPTGADLLIPSVYVWFGAATVWTIVVLLSVGLVALRRTPIDLPAAPGTVEHEIAARPGVARALGSTRRWAAMAHRAEPIVGVLAAATLLATLAAVAFAVLIALLPGLAPPQLRAEAAAGWFMGAYRAGVDAAVWGVAVAGLGVLGGLVGGAVAGRTRPLGLVWDLICFLPRTGHPFGPPCYAERVVPELTRRWSEWLAVGADRRLVVSAHSLGAVLAVAALHTARVETPGLIDRVALLTYGTQLRAYFGRMFPELLGPEALGTAPGLGAGLLSPDPWAAARATDDGAAPGPVPAASTRGVLTEDAGLRWVNLWRRTDYLGFPVDRWTASDVDRPAEEIDVSGYLPQIATHGGYTRTAAYADAVVDLLGRFARGSRAGGPEAGGDLGGSPPEPRVRP